MKKEDAEKYLKRFPALTASIKREAEKTLAPYIIYDRKKKIGRCTHCGKLISLRRNKFVNHTRMTCTICGADAELIDSLSGYQGFKTESRSNVIIFLNKRGSENLYIRCFTLEMYFGRGQFKSELEPQISYIERRRYIFTPTGNAEYLQDYDYRLGKYAWRVASRVNEPYFGNWGGVYEINYSALEKTYYRYSALIEWETSRERYYAQNSINYLKFYRRHTGAERLVKCGLAVIVDNCLISRSNGKLIDWKQTEVTKMLKLNKAELDFVRNDPHTRYFEYLQAREMFPMVTSPDKRFCYYLKTKYCGLKDILQRTGKTALDVARYIVNNDICDADYRDYFRDCLRLGYDVTSDVIAFPPHFYDAHDRAADAVVTLDNHIKQERLDVLKKRREMLCKDFGDYVIVQPADVADIIREGRLQGHCVGGYAGRHCDGKLTIMFLRKKSDPDKPFYTMEISNDLKIVQCRGYRNNRDEPKPPEVKAIEQEYAQYLKSILPKWKKSSKQPLKAEKQERIGA